ncbi:hypothetical protein VIGAN_11193700 [Vigna angularis var. angularis]|uniref:Uncharacterized protein n=1 Tax=Vigna angularis var. angularis TaxID=157739 RepID=A0A0S3TB28_PHAAN|nr:hypothetical protein VIGAN_11193700 [Vigna angularis var. angularis]
MVLSSLHCHPIPYTVITQRHTTPFSFSISSTFRFSSTLSSSTFATHHPFPLDFSPSQLLDLLCNQHCAVSLRWF